MEQVESKWPERREEETLLEREDRIRLHIEKGLGALDRALERMPMAMETEKGLVVPNVSSSVEKLGLRGSVEKRRAWVHHKLSLHKSKLAEHLVQSEYDDPARLQRIRDEEHFNREQSRRALLKARDHYHEAFETSMATYWAGVQFLSLTLVTDQYEEVHKHYWKIAEAAAELDVGSEDREHRAWAYGSLMELALLELVVGPPAKNRAAERRVDQMWEAFRKEAPEDSPAWKSTVRQMRRYVNWWTHLGAAHEKAKTIWADEHD